LSEGGKHKKFGNLPQYFNTRKCRPCGKLPRQFIWPCHLERKGHKVGRTVALAVNVFKVLAISWKTSRTKTMTPTLCCKITLIHFVITQELLSVFPWVVLHLFVNLSLCPATHNSPLWKANEIGSNPIELYRGAQKLTGEIQKLFGH